MPKKPTVDNKDDQPDLVAELTADLQRLQADFINYKARAERERSDALKLGREMAVVELLPVFDNLERAYLHTPPELAENTWVKGIKSLEKQLESILGGLGLQKIKTIGEPFDPNTMDAVSAEDGEGEEIVSEELQSGYILGEKVLRPAMVKVKR